MQCLSCKEMRCVCILFDLTGCPGALPYQASNLASLKGMWMMSWMLSMLCNPRRTVP
jgi:hypothetical protein